MDRIKSIFSNSWYLLGMCWKEDKLTSVIYFTTIIIAASFDILVYFLYKYVIDSLTQGNTLAPFSTFFLLLLLYITTKYVSQFLYTILVSNYYEYVLFVKLQYYSGRLFMKKLAQLDFAQIEDGEMRNLIAKVYQTYSWRVPGMVRKLGYIGYNAFSLGLTLFIVFQFNITYFLILALIALPFYFLRAKYSGESFAIYSDRADKVNFMWYLQNIFTQFPLLSEIKLYNLSNHFIHQLKTVQQELFRAYKKPIEKFLFAGAIEYLLIPTVLFLALQNIIHQVSTHSLTIGDFTLYAGLIMTFTGDLANILSNFNSVYEDNLYVTDYVQFLKTRPALPQKAQPVQITDFKEITFSHVTFSYPGNTKKVLEDVSFTIQKGDDIAIVGHNGAGKSTLVKLLLRFYDPTAGDISIDGHNLKDIDGNSWYQCIGALFQDFARYNLSLEENILFGNISKKDTKAVDEALEAAQAKEIMQFLTNGIQQRLGKWFEDGEEISVGQWQKVAIARALYRNAPLLILDEPTANIDAEAEYKIFENLKKVYKDKSLIFISHRFSTVRMADKIFVLNKGKLVEQGSHKNLLQHKGLYSKYFSLQRKGYE